MSVRDAEPGDIYADFNGKLWRVTGTCSEPTVYVEEVEPFCGEAGSVWQKVRRSGGVSGLMWQGFKRIFRPLPVQIPRGVFVFRDINGNAYEHPDDIPTALRQP